MYCLMSLIKMETFLVVTSVFVAIIVINKDREGEKNLCRENIRACAMADMEPLGFRV